MYVSLDPETTKERFSQWTEGRCEHERGIDRMLYGITEMKTAKRARRAHHEIYPREITFMLARLRQHITRSCLLEVQSLCEISLLNIHALIAKRLILVNPLVAAVRRW